jgi:hypothetical protein
MPPLPGLECRDSYRFRYLEIPSYVHVQMFASCVAVLRGGQLVGFSEWGGVL